MDDLEQLITEWRRNTLEVPGINREAVDELESHLRDSVEQLVSTGLTESKAFQMAVAILGQPSALAPEFQKLDGSMWWPIKIATGIASLGALAWGAYFLFPMFTRYKGQLTMTLLLTHVFFITAGYFATYLLGALGICYVCQHNWTAFSPQKEKLISRTYISITGVVAWFALVGLVLGAAWAKAEWGRYWAWDSRETGSLCVAFWLLLTLAVHRQLSTVSLMMMGIFGNIIVSVAWFANRGVISAMQYGIWDRSLPLLLVIAIHLALIMVAWLPQGWLRFSRH